MNVSVRKPFPALFVFCLLVLFSSQIARAQQDAVWRPVSPAELQMKTPQVEPDADAEAIFWEVRLDDKKAGSLSYRHYVRVKIFTERGRERFSKLDIPFVKGKKVEDVAARVIKPDGSIVALNPQDIFEREIVNARKIKIKAVSFAVPGIEPGVIVEYQYREVIKGDSASGERLIFQRDVPIQKVSYHVRPYQNTTLKYTPYNMSELRFSEDRENKGFYVGTLTNVPAYKEEPYMPPDDEVRRWVYLSYQNLGSIFRWEFMSEGYGRFFRDATKPNKEIKAKAAELTAGATTDDEKLRRLYEFTQKQIRNISYDPSFTDEQRENLKIKDADDALKRGMGSSMWVDLLFASLAKAAGFDVALVISGDRSENFFSPDKYSSPQFVHPACIAVGVGNGWRYFNPGTPYLPFGRLVWYEENVQGMLIGESSSNWKQSPLSDYKDSLAKRTGKFKLLEDGTLEGTVRLEYDGHQAINRRRAEFTDSPAKREESIKEDIKQRLSTADVTGITIENFTDPSKPLVYVLNVRVPNYAQKTGKRLFIQPGFFESGAKPVFSSATRVNSIYFPYPWSEEDLVEIELPKGFALDNADAPAEVADPNRIGALKITMRINDANNTLTYRRTFHFGGNGMILFPVTSYQPVKNLFDAFHKADSHTITLKQAAAN
jgi:hypothetical protein